MDTQHRIAVAIILALLVIFGSFALLAASVHGETSASGWQHIKKIKLQMTYTNTDVHTSYYDRVILHFTLINATDQDDFQNNTFCTPSPNFPYDIRFTLDPNSSEFLPQFIEYYEDGNGNRIYPHSRVNVYVRVPRGTTELYVLYDNPTAHIYSVPEQVFDYYDDFNYTSLENLKEYYSVDSPCNYGYLSTTNTSLYFYRHEKDQNPAWPLARQKTGILADIKNTTITVITCADYDAGGIEMRTGIHNSQGGADIPYFSIGISSSCKLYVGSNSYSVATLSPNYAYFASISLNYTEATAYIHNIQDTIITHKAFTTTVSHVSTWYPHLEGHFQENKRGNMHVYYEAVYVNQNNNVTIYEVEEYTPHLPTDDNAGGSTGGSSGAGVPMWNFLKEGHTIAGYTIANWMWMIVLALLIVLFIVLRGDRLNKKHKRRHKRRR